MNTCALHIPVVICILSFDKKNDTLDCLESVFQMDYSPFEVVIVDNGSTDGSPEAIAELFPQVHLIRKNKNFGAPGGRNIGMNYIQENFNHPFILILDNDTIVDKHYLRYLVQALYDDSHAGIACGKAYTEFPSKTILSVGMKANLYTGFINDIGKGQSDEGQFDYRRYVDACGGFGLLVRKEMMVQLQGFDERYNPYGFEDADFCFRARKMGYKTLYMPKALVYHKGTNFGRGPVACYEKSKVKNYFLFLRRHSSLRQRFSSVVFILFKAFTIFVQMLFQGKGHIIVSQFKGFFEGIRKDEKVIAHSCDRA